MTCGPPKCTVRAEPVRSKALTDMQSHLCVWTRNPAMRLTIISCAWIRCFAQRNLCGVPGTCATAIQVGTYSAVCLGCQCDGHIQMYFSICLPDVQLASDYAASFTLPPQKTAPYFDRTRNKNTSLLKQSWRMPLQYAGKQACNARELATGTAEGFLKSKTAAQKAAPPSYIEAHLKQHCCLLKPNQLQTIKNCDERACLEHSRLRNMQQCAENESKHAHLGACASKPTLGVEAEAARHQHVQPQEWNSLPEAGRQLPARWPLRMQEYLGDHNATSLMSKSVEFEGSVQVCQVSLL